VPKKRDRLALLGGGCDDLPVELSPAAPDEEARAGTIPEQVDRRRAVVPGPAVLSPPPADERVADLERVLLPPLNIADGGVVLLEFLKQLVPIEAHAAPFPVDTAGSNNGIHDAGTVSGVGSCSAAYSSTVVNADAIRSSRAGSTRPPRSTLLTVERLTLANRAS